MTTTARPAAARQSARFAASGLALPGAAASRLAGLLLVLLVGLVGWGVLAAQHRLIWSRMPASTIERFTADRVPVALPTEPGLVRLQSLCAAPPAAWTAWWRAALRNAVAHCLADPEQRLSAAAADAASADYQRAVLAQLAAAQAWLADYDQHAGNYRQALTAQLNGSPPGDAAWWTSAGSTGLRLAANLGWVIPQTPREAVGRRDDADRMAGGLRERVAATQARLQALADPTLATADRARALALMASGLQLGTDYGYFPPRPVLETNRATLAEALEWQRRAQGFAQRGFNFDDWRALPAGLALGTLVLCAVAAALARGRTLAAWGWLAAGLLIGAGAIVLTDLALTGDPGQRYLFERQFIRFSLGEHTVPLLVHLPLPGGLGQLALWWPMLALAGVVGLLGAVRDGSSRWLAPLRMWSQWGANPRVWWLQASLLLAVGGAAVLVLHGNKALLSDLLIFVGALGLASYFSQQAPYANAGGRVEWINFSVVLAALAGVIGVTAKQGDLGHLLVALMMFASFAWLFNWAPLRWFTLLLTGAGAALLVASLVAGHWVPPLAGLFDHFLPLHAQERMAAMFDPFHVDASDLARVQWLIANAGADGWGPGYVPWQGLTGATRAQDALPLQAPSDYVLALTTGLWGRTLGLGVLAASLALFIGAASIGLRTALRPGFASVPRLLAGLGGFGCIVMAGKVVLSVAGVSGVLPLTGLPVALVGYGPVTLIFALLYLALALGLQRAGSLPAERGVYLRPPQAARGDVRQRGVLMALAVSTGLALLLATGWAKMRAAIGQQPQRQVSQARLDLADAVAQALVPAVANPLDNAAAPTACPELAAVTAAWNQRLSVLHTAVRAVGGHGGLATDSLRLDPARLLAQHPVASAQDCVRLARTLGKMLETDLPRLVGTAALGMARAPTPGALNSGLAAFEKPRAVAARPLDYSTHNAWWGLPGCLMGADAAQAPRLDGASKPCQTARADGVNPPLADAATDAWLQRDFAPQVEAALRQPTGQRMVNHRPVPTGPVLGVTLVRQWQHVAQQIAECFTGRLHGADCDGVLPLDPVWRQRFFGDEGAIRAGALGITLAEIDSGRVVAMAGAVSDCSLAQLGRRAVRDTQGMPALLDGLPCAQLPDQRSAYLAQQHPALWLVPPGSSIKPLAMAAAIDAGLIAPADDLRWRAILAESHDGKSVQRVAMAAGAQYLDVLGGAGFGAPRTELLWGLAVASNLPQAPAPFGARWLSDTRIGTQGLRATTLSFDQSAALRAEKLAGVNLGKRYGAALDSEFVAARALADASLGGGNVRINAVGLLEIWRRLDLRARGKSDAPGLHLLEQPGQAVATGPLGFVSPAAARRALSMTEGITASRLKGTAQGSCRITFGACPADGLPGLAGKTGSSDFLVQEKGSHVKDGLQLPAKLFGGVFTAPDGKRYAVAVMGLRVRDGQSKTLELSPSAPAEAALALMRRMGVKAP